MSTIWRNFFSGAAPGTRPSTRATADDDAHHANASDDIATRTNFPNHIKKGVWRTAKTRARFAARVRCDVGERLARALGDRSRHPHAPTTGRPIWASHQPICAKTAQTFLAGGMHSMVAMDASACVSKSARVHFGDRAARLAGAHVAPRCRCATAREQPTNRYRMRGEAAEVRPSRSPETKMPARGRHR